MADISEIEIQKLLAVLNDDLKQFPAGMNSLDIELESASKHVPAYVKIVKGHIDQLRSVLQLENHNQRALESIGLAKPVQQLMKIFEQLDENDVQLLEDLAFTARNWQIEEAAQLVAEKVEPVEITTS